MAHHIAPAGGTYVDVFDAGRKNSNGAELTTSSLILFKTDDLSLYAI